MRRFSSFLWKPFPSVSYSVTSLIGLFIPLLIAVFCNCLPQPQELPFPHFDHPWFRGTAPGYPLNAYEDEFPYIASIRHRRAHVCAGAILTDVHVVTTAVCCTRLSPVTRAEVVVGSHRLVELEQTEQRRRVIGYQLHPKRLAVSTALFAYDACVISLEKPLKASKNVTSISLVSHAPGSRLPHGAAKLTSAGWGAFPGRDQRQLLSNYLQRMIFSLPKNEAALCREVVGFDPETMFCIGSPPLLGKDPCRGDLGDPLVVSSARGGGRDELAGLATSALGCGKMPTVFTAISAVEEWVAEVVAAPQVVPGSSDGKSGPFVRYHRRHAADGPKNGTSNRAAEIRPS